MKVPHLHDFNITPEEAYLFALFFLLYLCLLITMVAAVRARRSTRKMEQALFGVHMSVKRLRVDLLHRDAPTSQPTPSANSLPAMGGPGEPIARIVSQADIMSGGTKVEA